MIALALLAAMQTGPLPGEPPSPPSPPGAVSPIDWSALPPLPYRRIPRPTGPMNAVVAAQMRHAACPMPAPVAGRVEMRVDVAVLIGADGTVRATIPRAVHCATVEQYAAGLVVSFARGNLVQRLVNEGGWYRATLLFDWAP